MNYNKHIDLYVLVHYTKSDSINHRVKEGLTHKKMETGV